LFKLRGFFNGHTATLLLDSGASSEFIDPAFARRCGLELQKSNREIKLADGTVSPAAGRVETECLLAAATGQPIPFTATFTATPLEGYDAILGMTWLEKHNPQIGWANRSITLHHAGAPPRLVKPLEYVNESAPTGPARIATIGMQALRKAHRRGQIEELFAVLVREKDGKTVPVSREDSAAEALLNEYADVFPDDLPPVLPPKRGVEHRIELKPDARPPQCRPLRHQSPKDLAVFDEYIRKGIEAGHIRVSNSPYGAMALIVRKKDGTPRVVVDYRALNELTVKNKYPLPLMDEMFDRVHGAKFFTKIDLRTGFHQIRLAEVDIEKTAFRTRYGSFEYLVMPMGLCNAPSTFMQLMNETFRDMLDKSVLVFLDDILVFSRTKEEHIAHVREVLTRLRVNKLFAKRSKCEFFRDEVEFLGHRIGAKGLSVSPDKIDAVKAWPRPKDLGEVRSFLGLAGFYRRFVKDYSKGALPLTELTKEKVPFAWGAAQQAAFDALKTALCAAPVLLVPDPSKPYTLNCDACDFAIGATLQQDHGHGLQPVAYRSKKLSAAERNYDTREKEFMALVDACSHWRHYLHGDQPFTLLSDHDSLKYHKTMPHLSGRLARWVEKMAEFDYRIEHIPGHKNVVADALSRRADLRAPVEALAAVLAAGHNTATEELERERNRAAAESSRPAAPDLPRPNAKGAIVMPSQRCTATTRRGAHCQQRTAKGQYCWNHLRVIAGLRIKRSNVPGAGMGLFAARDLPAGYDVDYTGDRVRLDTAADGGAYFLQIRRDEAIDAARTNAGEARWVNDPRGTDMRANSEFVLHTPPGRPRVAYVRTLRRVPRGEEILVKYGAQYWRYALKGKSARKTKSKAAGAMALQREAPQAERLATMTKTTTGAKTNTNLIDRIRAAAREDTKYRERLAAPAAGYDASGGLLWHGERLCVPDDATLRTALLAECHDSTTGGHFGRDKTLDAMRKRFEWDGMATAAEQYVATCDSCQRNKPSRQLTPGALMPIPLPDKPCLEWTQDPVTGLPKTKRGHDAIVVYVERLCKLKHFAASHTNATAADLANSLVHNVVRLHGVPEAVISDRDPRITAHFYEELTKLLGSWPALSTSRHPQSDGQSEREIQTLITGLRAFCNEHQDDWDDYLDMFELAANSAVQASTGHTPFELLYGTDVRLPIDAALAPLAPKTPAAIDRAERMQKALASAREKLLSAQERQAKNARRRPASLAVGDSVLLSTEGLQLRGMDNKLCARYIGPFKVTSIVNPNAYTLELPPQLKALHHTFNIDKLKPYHDGSKRFPTRPLRYERPPPEAIADSNGDGKWEVREVLASRKRGRSPEYLVAWKGYPPEENTWEPESSLIPGARDRLTMFQRRQQASRD
jgi:hypothetical protein